MRSRWKARTEEGLEDETERMTEAEKPSKRKRRRAGEVRSVLLLPTFLRRRVARVQ